jgi:hypothetical protein
MSWRYRRHPSLCLTAVDGEGVVLHLGTRRCFSVSATGLEILEALRTAETAETLTARLTARYDVSEETAADSVQAFLDSCVGSGLVLAESPRDISPSAGP